MAKPKSEWSTGSVLIKGRRYPSAYAPGRGTVDLDDVWVIVDGIPGLSDIDRFYTAGQIMGVISKARERWPAVLRARDAAVAQSAFDELLPKLRGKKNKAATAILSPSRKVRVPGRKPKR